MGGGFNGIASSVSWANGGRPANDKKRRAVTTEQRQRLAHSNNTER